MVELKPTVIRYFSFVILLLSVIVPVANGVLDVQKVQQNEFYREWATPGGHIESMSGERLGELFEHPSGATCHVYYGCEYSFSEPTNVYVELYDVTNDRRLQWYEKVYSGNGEDFHERVQIVLPMERTRTMYRVKVVWAGGETFGDMFVTSDGIQRGFGGIQVTVTDIVVIGGILLILARGGPALVSRIVNRGGEQPLSYQESQHFQEPQSTEEQQYQCNTCGGQLTWIEEYQRWYCHSCKNYA